MLDLEKERLLTLQEVQRLFGGVSRITITRWGDRDDLRFPKPIFIGNNKFFRAVEIEEFIRSRPAECPYPPKAGGVRA